MSLRLINRFHRVGGTSQMPYHLTAAVRRQDVMYNTMMFPLQLNALPRCMDAPYTSAPNMENVIFSKHNQEGLFLFNYKFKSSQSPLQSKPYHRQRVFFRPCLLLCYMLLPWHLFQRTLWSLCQWANCTYWTYLCLYRRSSNFPAGCCFIWMTSDGCLTG